MILPLLSVTAIGLVVGLALGAAERSVLRGVLRAVAGAWVGFAVGALVGLAVDVVAGSGAWLGWVGHLGALGYAVASFQVERESRTRHRPRDHRSGDAPPGVGARPRTRPGNGRTRAGRVDPRPPGAHAAAR